LKTSKDPMSYRSRECIYSFVHETKPREPLPRKATSKKWDQIQNRQNRSGSFRELDGSSRRNGMGADGRSCVAFDIKLILNIARYGILVCLSWRLFLGKLWREIAMNMQSKHNQLAGHFTTWHFPNRL
jgi:hypothetical protein